jgi:predicted ABC-type exoprotein transport system permease subunit
VGPWVHEHRVLRIAVVVLAALVVVFIDRPTGAAILGVAFVLIVLLGVIEFLDQPREHTPPPDGPSRVGAGR